MSDKTIRLKLKENFNDYKSNITGNEFQIPAEEYLIIFNDI
ncbi:hypothetical protein SDC9_197539 [bioreactor metagenome]|uniref:Uncharacterized protein n=1 Tax=bioreactor metagenome TaxID=1076179 RepID=A0A645IF49_9ZZZZ